MTTIRTAAALLIATVLAGCAAMPGAPHARRGMVAVKSPHGQAETLSRLQAQVRQRNLAIVARIDHAAGAQRIKQTLRPTEVTIFGNPQAGTPLMPCAQGAGIELPLKALAAIAEATVAK